jgi:diguanylate cyclase (GGDEF)-like protein/PAS domain S-box-containing protein
MIHTTEAVRIAALAGPFHEQILEHIADGIYFVDRDRTIAYWNRGAERLTGYQAADVVGRRCFDNLLAHVDVDGHGLCDGRCPLVAAVADGCDHEAEVWLRHRDGSRRPVRVRTSPIRARDGAIIGAVEIFDDATELLAARRKAAAAERDALLDDLTTLPNRRFLNMMLAARVEDAARYGDSFALLMVDVDRFKGVNDLYGHTVGDEALRVVGATLWGAIREGDFAARWGGEEFVVLAQHTGAPEAMALAERLRAMVGSALISVPGGTLVVTASIGVATALPGEPADDVLARADAALFTAKRAGRNRAVAAD